MPPPTTQPRAHLAHPDAPSQEDAQDLALVAAIKKGDQAAWSTLIKRYQDRLFSVCLRMVRDRDLAADLTQDAFVKAITGIDTFDGRSKFSTWLIRVTMNACLSKLRSEKLRRHASLSTPEWADGDGDGPRGVVREVAGEPPEGLSVEAREERALVLRALAELDPDQRAILILCDCRGLAYEQIAEVLGIAVGTVKSRVFRARSTLRALVEKG